jgi:hypothetical protein
MHDLPFKWAREGDGPWHRISGAPADSVNTLCGQTLTVVDDSRSEPPPESAARCRLCEIEGEGAPPNH